MELKIAFPTNDRLNIEEHFGHYTKFKRLNTKDGKVILEDFLIPPAHKPSILGGHLSSTGSPCSHNHGDHDCNH